MVEHNSATNRYTSLILQKLFKCLDMVLNRKGGQQRAVLEDSQAKGAQCHGREGRIEGSDEVFVEPLCLFNLEAQSGNRRQVLLRKIDDEPDA